MLALVLRDWDPEAIRLRMQRRRARKDVIAAWAKATGPENHHLWPLRPEMNRLEEP